MSWLSDLIARVLRPRYLPTTPGPIPLPADAPLALLAEHNLVRSRHDLPPLWAEPRLQRAAQAHADHMARTGRLGHFGIGDGTPWERIAATGYRWRVTPDGYVMATEDVARGQRTVIEAMASWLHSPGHRDAILGTYLHFGGAVARGADGQPYWCCVFALPESVL